MIPYQHAISDFADAAVCADADADAADAVVDVTNVTATFAGLVDGAFVATADAPSAADAIASGDAFTAVLVAADASSADVDAIASAVAVVNVNLLPDLLRFVCPINPLL